MKDPEQQFLHQLFTRWQQVKNFSSRPGFLPRLFFISLTALAVLPFLYFLGQLFFEPGRFSLAAFRDAFVSPASFLLIRQTLLVFLAAAVAMGIGVPLGFFLSAVQFPLRRVFLAMLVAPLVLPVYIWVFGWELLLGRRGYLGELAGEGVGDAAGMFFSSIPGAVFVLGLYFAGVAALTVMLFIQWGWNGFSVDGGRSWRANFGLFLGKYLRSFLCWAGIFIILIGLFKESSALLIFGLTTLNTEIFVFFNTFYDLNFISSTGLIVFLLAALFWAVWELSVKKNLGLLSGRALIGKIEMIPAGASEALLFWVFLFSMTAFYFFPVWIFFIRADSLLYFQEAFRTAGVNILITVLFAAIASLCLALLVFGFDSFRKRSGNLLASGAEKIMAFLFFIPGVLTGAVVNRFWHHRWSVFIYTTMAMLVFGMIVQYLYPLLFLKKWVEKEKKVTVTSAEGRIRLWRKRTVTFFIVFAGVFVSIRELSSAVFLAPAGQETLLVKIFALKAVEMESVLSALVVLYLILIGLLMGAGLFFWRVPQSHKPEAS
ncbi:MAG: hypothetical protein HY586_07935 [Candidatus Omnitrophica bacterium]|nr:hypothetical protein [Candidatus Omnitrophota bacterium]